MGNNYADVEALKLSRKIAEIYRQDCIGGDVQKQAKVQVLLSEYLENMMDMRK